MADIPSTRASLMVRLRDRLDQEAWREFVRLYAPVVYRFCRRRGLQDADAADLTQEVLRSVAGSVAAFDPGEGTFRSWLYTLVHRRLYDWQQARLRQPLATGDPATQMFLEATPARDDEDFWNQQYERQLFSLAGQRIQASFSVATWQAFWQTAVDGKSAKEVAQTLGTTVAAVYLAKSRVMVKLKAEIARLQTE